MSVKFTLSIKEDRTEQGQRPYYTTNTLAELDLELLEAVAWELYRHAVERVTSPGVSVWNGSSE